MCRCMTPLSLVPTFKNDDNAGLSQHSSKYSKTPLKRRCLIQKSIPLKEVRLKFENLLP